MGSVSSKFKKYLQRGDEFAAMHTFQASAELRRNLDPNVSYGDQRQHNTALHYAARHGMKHLLRTFLADLGGNPNKRNALNETVLHCACQLAPAARSFSAQERRAACVALLLQWRGAALPSGGREKADIEALDRDANTPLHWAAAAGLRRCVELLLAHGAPLFAENRDRLTPCDLAVRAAHHDVAQLLETRMVFADGPNNELPLLAVDTVNEDDEFDEDAGDEVYSGLRAQDLQEAKDQLLVETSDMLHIPLFTAEAILRHNEWSREALLEKWIKDPVECCILGGVEAPAWALDHVHEIPPKEMQDDLPLDFLPVEPEAEMTCDICLTAAVTPEGDPGAVTMSCRHRFCLSCWERYLTVKIQDGDAHHILCPAYQCHILVPVDVIERLVSPEMARRYLQFDIKAFVDTNRSIKWCPVAGCGRAVRLPEAEQRRNMLPQTGDTIPATSHAVDCGAGHLFCWECLGEAHAPCGCSRWLQWQCKVAEVRPEQLRAAASDSHDAANCLWLVTNCKPCPNCSSPIQKNEGCNHMKCSKCKFDFCWVCQESWKRHSSATGGYFRCNRFEAAQRADERQGSLLTEAAARNTHAQELARFLHYYTRFRNHENSQRLEEPLLSAVRHKMQALAAAADAAGATISSIDGARFIEDGVRELLKARRVLCGSYVHGYYLEDEGHGRAIFEFMQNELEEVTEKLSEMVARPYLRTPRAVIVQTTALARRKRHEFVRAVAEGLVPPETPPEQRRVILSEEEALCTYIGCNRPRVVIDGMLTMYCGEQCASNADAENSSVPELYHIADYNTELVIALEMSRLQMIEDKMKQAQAVGSDGSVETTPARPPDDNSSDSGIEDQLRLAIQLSLQESTAQISRQEESSKSSGEPAAVTSDYQRTSADITVDCFLKSLANRKLEAGTTPVPIREFLFKPCNGNEDGRFQISDIHENGYTFGDIDEFYDGADGCLKRSHSTGDLCIRRSGRGFRVRTAPEEPRYHLDSDHSSQHDEKPEDVYRRSGVVRYGNKMVRSLPSNIDPNGQSSVEDTTTSDSLNADMEVCDILGSAGSDSGDPPENTKMRLCVVPKTGHLSKLAVNKSIELLSDDTKLSDVRKLSPASRRKAHKDPNLSRSVGFLPDTQRRVPNATKLTPAPTTANSGLRIRICKSPIVGSAPIANRHLETDSSNEYESETGIPKSPTLFISGVSISRTPEPKSPAAALVGTTGRQSRSASLSKGDQNVEKVNEVESGDVLVVSSNVEESKSPLASPRLVSEPQTPAGGSNNKTKSASEPEREREVFRFPKSSTDGALSSVLHVQESNLSSDDFHEALFLLERSPKTRDSKRRKKSKKKDKEDRCKEEVSSAL